MHTIGVPESSTASTDAGVHVDTSTGLMKGASRTGTWPRASQRASALWDPVVRAVGGSAKRESELLVIALWDALRPGEGVITIGYVQLVRARRLEFDLVGGRGILGAHAGRVAQRAALEDTDRTRQPQSTTTSKPGTHQTAPQRPEHAHPNRIQKSTPTTKHRRLISDHRLHETGADQGKTSRRRTWSAFE